MNESRPRRTLVRVVVLAPHHRSHGCGAHLPLDSSLLLIRCEYDPDERGDLLRKPKPAVLVVDENGHDIDRLVRIALVVGQRQADDPLDILNPRCRSEFVVRPVFHLREHGPQVRRRGGHLLEFHALTSTAPGAQAALRSTATISVTRSWCP